MKLVLYQLYLYLNFRFIGLLLTILKIESAEDVYEYALMIEDGKDHPWFFHKHHLIYAPLIKGFMKL